MTTTTPTIHMDLRQLPALNALQAPSKPPPDTRAFPAPPTNSSSRTARSVIRSARWRPNSACRCSRATANACVSPTRGRQYAAEVRAALVALAESTRRNPFGRSRPAADGVDAVVVFGAVVDAARRQVHRRASGNAISNCCRPTRSPISRATTWMSRSASASANIAGLHSEELLDEVFFPACSPNFHGGKLPRTPPISRTCRCCARKTNSGARGSTRPGSRTCDGTEARRSVPGFVESAAGGHRRSGHRAHAPLARDAGNRVRDGSCGCSTSTARARGSTTSCARRRCFRRSACRHSGTGCSRGPGAVRRARRGSRKRMRRRCATRRQGAGSGMQQSTTLTIGWPVSAR